MLWSQAEPESYSLLAGEGGINHPQRHGGKHLFIWIRQQLMCVRLVVIVTRWRLHGMFLWCVNVFGAQEPFQLSTTHTFTPSLTHTLPRSHTHSLAHTSLSHSFALTPDPSLHSHSLILLHTLWSPAAHAIPVSPPSPPPLSHGQRLVNVRCQ